MFQINLTCYIVSHGTGYCEHSARRLKTHNSLLENIFLIYIISKHLILFWLFVVIFYLLVLCTESEHRASYLLDKCLTPQSHSKHTSLLDSNGYEDMKSNVEILIHSYRCVLHLYSLVSYPVPVPTLFYSLKSCIKVPIVS